MPRRSGNPVSVKYPQNVAYADEVAANLYEMEVEEERVIPTPPPTTLGFGGLFPMLEIRGWFRGMHYEIERVTVAALGGAKTPKVFSPVKLKKIKRSVAANKFHKEPNDSLTSCINHSRVTPPQRRTKMSKNHKNSAAELEPNYSKLRDIMLERGLTVKALAEITGYSETTIYGFTMPDRSSSRAGTITDRFLELLAFKLQAQDLKTN